MLTKLEETAQSVSNHSSQVSSMDVSKADRVDSKSSLSRKQQIPPNSSTLAAALPNLVRHLRQPAGQREESRQQNQPTAAVSTSYSSSQISSAGRCNQLAGIYTTSIISSQARPSHVVQQPHTLPSSSQSMNSKNSNGPTASANQQLSGGSGVAAATVPVSSTDLSQPVPLPDLIKHGFIKPGVDCISCVVMVTQTSLILRMHLMGRVGGIILA